jgi:hypothetical protein
MFGKGDFAKKLSEPAGDVGLKDDAGDTWSPPDQSGKRSYKYKYYRRCHLV